MTWGWDVSTINLTRSGGVWILRVIKPYVKSIEQNIRSTSADAPRISGTVASSGTGTHASFQAVPEPFDDPRSFVLIGVKRVTLSEVGFVFPPTLITHLKKTKMCQNWNVMFPSIFSTCQKQVRSFRWNSRSRNCQKQVWTMTPPKKKTLLPTIQPGIFPNQIPPSKPWLVALYSPLLGRPLSLQGVCNDMDVNPRTRILLPRSFNIFTNEKWWERKTIRLFLGFDTFSGENC